jgi:hypothetical protein
VLGMRLIDVPGGSGRSRRGKNGEKNGGLRHRSMT